MSDWLLVVKGSYSFESRGLSGVDIYAAQYPLYTYI